MAGTLEIISPATLFDMAELGGGRTRMEWAILREMWSGGLTWSCYLDEKLVCLAGLYPLGDNSFEAWFNFTPAMSSHLNQLLGQIRLTLRSGDYREIAVICRSRAGRVLARRAGFTFAENCEQGEIWTWKL